MRNIISALIIIPFLFSGIIVSAQNIPPDRYRIATPKEILLHDNPYNILQQEIETKICDADWNITKKPFLLSDNRNEKIVIIDYLKGVGNLPVFTRENDAFEIKMKPESPLYKSNEDEIKKQTDAYVARTSNISSADKKELAVIKTKNEEYEKNLKRLSDDKTYGSISLEINQSAMYVNDEGKGSTKALIISGVHQGILQIEYPYEASVDTTYRATLFIGNWPNFSGTKTPSFHFIKNNDSDPVIENMTIEISAFNYNKLMKMIHSIDWTKLEALVKK